MTPKLPLPLQFPAQEAIATYLENHPLTDGSYSPYLKKSEAYLNKRIIEAVAQALAEKCTSPGSIKVWVELAIDSPDKKITLSNESRLWAILNLTFALQQCAKANSK
jgi:hypothetical protein